MALHIIQLLFACWCLIGVGAVAEHGDVDENVVITTMLIGAIIGVVSFALGVA